MRKFFLIILKFIPEAMLKLVLFLSGGADSTLVTAYSNKIKKYQILLLENLKKKIDESIIAKKIQNLLK